MNAKIAASSTIAKITIDRVDGNGGIVRYVIEKGKTTDMPPEIVAKMQAEAAEIDGIYGAIELDGVKV